MDKNSDIADKLRNAGMRPTRQRVALGELLFNKGDRHVCAETLHEEALVHQIPVSLATIYNSLNQFRDAGLLREVALVGNRFYFDTNMSDHYHYYIEETGELMDIPDNTISIEGIPEVSEGMEIVGVDVVVRIRSQK